MDALLSTMFIWLGAALGCFVCCTVVAIKIENEYRAEFHLPTIPWKSAGVSIAVTGFLLVLYCWVAQQRIPSTVFVSFAVAAASLLGIWRVDRLTLLIPDRFQIAGAIAGISYVLLLIASGENIRELLLETGFGLAMVALLWLLSFIYLRLRGSVGFGMGDVKLLAWLALFAGKRMPDLILISIGIGILQVIGLTLAISWRQRKITLPGAQDAFAFGPAIVLSVVIEGLLHYA